MRAQKSVSDAREAQARRKRSPKSEVRRAPKSATAEHRWLTAALARASEQPEESDRAVPAGPAGAGDRRERLGQEHAGPRVPAAGASITLRASRSRTTHHAPRNTPRLSHSPAANPCRPSMRWTSRPSAARRARSRPPTWASLTTSGSCSPRCPRRGCAAIRRAGSPSTARRAAARSAKARATIKLEMNFLPPGLRALRDLRRDPVQPRDARHRIRRQEHRRGAGAVGGGGHGVLRQPAEDQTPACRRCTIPDWIISSSARPARRSAAARRSG